MNGVRDHAVVAAECLGHHARGKGLIPLAAADPALHILLRVIEKAAEALCLAADDMAGVKRLAQPFARVALLHDLRRVQPLCAVFTAAIVPAGLDRQPIAPVQTADVNTVAVIPHGVAVVIRYPVCGRVIIAVHVLDDLIGVRELHNKVTAGEEVFQFRTDQMSVRLVIGVRKRLVDITDDDIARMLTHHARHLLRLPDALRDAEAAHDAEQRKIRLRHKAELVAVFVDLILHRPLRQTQKIHVAEFGQQNIVDQLRKIAAQHVLLLKAHRIGPAQTDGAAIEIEHPLALRTFCVLRKAAHTKLLCKAVGARPVYKNGCMELVQIRGFQIPQLCVRQVKFEFVQILSVLERHGNALSKLGLDGGLRQAVAHADKARRLRRKAVVFKDRLGEVLPVE